MKLPTRVYLALVFLGCYIFLFPLVCQCQSSSQDNIDFPDSSDSDYYRGDYYEEDEAFSVDDEVVPDDEGQEQPVVQSRPQPLAPGLPIKIEEKSIRLGRIPYRSLKEMMTQAVPLLRLLQKKSGAKQVSLVSSGKDYTSILDSLARGKIDFAWVGPAAYLKRRDKDKLMPVAKAKFGSETAYRGVFIAPAKGKVQGLEDIRGSKIGFVDPESTSGYIYPMYLLLQLGINPHKHSSVAFLKNHDNVLRAVLEGKVDAGVCLEDTLNSLQDKDLLKKLIVLAKTDEIPSDIIVCRQDCPINLRERFQEALLQINAKELPGKSLTFLPALDGDFESVEAIMLLIDSLKNKKETSKKKS